HLAAGIDNLSRGGAKMIALDWVQEISLVDVVTGKTPQAEAAREHYAQYDARLAEALSRAPDVVFVKIATGQSGERGWLRPTTELLYSRLAAEPQLATHIDDILGYAELSSKEAIISSQPPAVGSHQAADYDVSFAARITERLLRGQSQLLPNAWKVQPSQSTSRGVMVPLREDGSVLINYRPYSGLGGAFQRYSLFDVANGKVPSRHFKDKIVLIGATFSGSNDFHYVPVLKAGDLSRARQTSGVEIQANLARTLLSGQPIREPHSTTLWLMSIAVGGVGLLAFGALRWMPAALACLSLASSWLLLSVWSFVALDFALPAALPLLGLTFTGALMGSYRALGEERERSHVLSLWGRYQNPRIVDYLLRHPEARGGQGQEVNVTVLFADLKNFTKTVEHLSPGDAIAMLNRYLGLMQETVEEFDGYVDKYLGDGLMAQWGAPDPNHDHDTQVLRHEEAAVRACLELERRTRELTASIAGGRDVTFGLRLTLHSGPVVVGWVGAGRIEFTIIGDTVNVCSRLQETAKALNCEFLVSESTYEAVRGWVETGQEAEVEIRGRNQPLRVYEILGEKAVEGAGHNSNAAFLQTVGAAKVF
ncbi:MAG: adenylate cyclase, partial [Abditibacteriota bacterium]|nr:adenylate cyclase [Abditibacteriota bacterium]